MDENSLRYAYSARHPILKTAATNLEAKIRDDLAEIQHIDRVSFRAKAIDSFVGKVVTRRIGPPYEHPLREVEDQVAGRILVFFRRDIETVQGRLAETLTFVESSRREPQKDAEFGYESHHLVCLIPLEVKPNGWADQEDMPTTFELQLRTLCMHAWAEPQHDVGYKSVDELSRENRRELAWIAASIWGADNAFERVLSRLARGHAE